MTETIKKLREYILPRTQKEFRRDNSFIDPSSYRQGPDLRLRSAKRLAAALDNEVPVILDGEKIVGLRTLANLPDILTEEENEAIWAEHYKHEQGWVCNICPDYTMLISRGLDAVIEEYKDDEPTVTALEAIKRFAGRYREKALETGRGDIADTLAAVPAKPAKTLREALQFLRLIHFALWAEGEYHMILGRFDQYMQPYYEHDINAGILGRDGALELVEDFFLNCNKDSDLYPGMQQGDNGQSIVLGGYDADGRDMFCEMSQIAFDASLELRVIDPKINLRVNRTTPIERYKMATRLTAAGLGFPQYENDDTVVPGLLRLGYDKEDAADYVVAACWEFIIPGVGVDVPNIDALSFAGIVNAAAEFDLPSCGSYEEFLAAVEKRIDAEAKRITEAHGGLWMRPAPLMSLMFREKRTNDVSDGAKYNNYGIHGTGIGPAVDSILAVKKLIYEDRTMDAAGLIAMLKSDFEGYETVRASVIADRRKFGADEPESNALASRLLSDFADAIDGIRNDRGGVWRAGTGSAMYYVFHARDIGASPDGRRAGGYLPANYSPSLGLKLPGPVSIVRSFTEPDLTKVINGGPLTLEFAASAVRDQAGIDKIAMLVRLFVSRGGHQLQLNVLDKAHLLDAQEHPEKYKNLVVRVWGWSGYFVELDKCYQDQIIQRADLTM